MGETVPFQKIDAEKISIAIVRQIELLILRGVLRPGERLPSERDLAERLGVSRPSLREAIADLQSRELLTSKAGAGVFVSSSLGASVSPALARLFSAHDEAVFDYVSFRRDMEGLAAERAAKFASETDLAVISSVFARMEAAHSKRSGQEEAALDAEFHMSIVEAGHNVVMLHMMRAMVGALREGILYNREAMFRQRTTRRVLLDQHRAIHEAIVQRHPEDARAAVENHLDFVESVLRGLRRAQHNEVVARQRLEHEAER